jgi:hypothetical protein
MEKIPWEVQNFSEVVAPKEEEEEEVHCPVPSSFLGPNVHLSTIFPVTLDLPCP